MAERASGPLQKLGEQLTCPVCLEFYKNPRALPCQHNFCQDCLGRCPREQQGGLQFLRCPTCRNVSQLPDGSVSKLPAAFTTNTLLELHREMLAKQNAMVCPQHEKPLEAFCETCQELACFYCATRSHSSHSVKMIADMIGDFRKELDKDLDKVKQQVSTLTDATEALNTWDEALICQGESAEQQIRDQVEEARDILDQAESNLILEVRTAVQQKRAAIALQKQEAQDETARLQTTIKFVEQSLEAQSSQQIMDSMTRTRDLMKLPHPQEVKSKFKASEKIDIEVKLNHKLVEECKLIGTVRYSLLCQKCHLVPRPIPLGKVATFQLSVRENDGSPVPISTRLISSQVSASNGPNPTDCTTKSTSPGKFEISYSPLVRGPHHLKVTVGGGEIPGSPFLVPVQPFPPENSVQPLHTIQGLKRPTGLAFSKDGRMIVSEGGAHCITIFSSDLQENRSIGSFGTKVNQFNGPASVAVTNDDRILVADSGNDRIQVLSMEGQFLLQIKSEGKWHFSAPLCVTVHSSGQVLFSERSTNRIHVLNSDLKFSYTFLTRGSKRAAGEGHPGIAVDSQGAIYIADYRNSFIQKYSLSGQFLAAIGAGGGQLFGPFGIVVDDSNHIYVSEGGNHRISKFTTKGKFVKWFEIPGCSGEKHSVALNALAMDSHGNLYMSDPFRNCVSVF